MKQIFGLLAILCAAGCSAKDAVEITFNVTGPVSRNAVIVLHDEITEIPLDEEGTGIFSLEYTDAAYARIYYGMDMKQIYFEAGDKAAVSFDGKDFNGTFLFEGEKAPAVDYLNKVQLTALPDESYALPFEEYLALTRTKTEEALSLLHAHNLEGTGKFVKMEEGRIRYSYATTLLMYPMAHRIMAGDMTFIPSGSYYEAIRSFFVEDADLAALDQYRDFMAECAHVLDEDNRDERELYPKLLAQMKYLTANCTDATVREALIHHITVPYIENFGTEGAQDMINIYLTYVNNPGMVAVFEAKCDKWDKKSSGKVSPDFIASDIDGKEYSLADFKGKYVYIDIWATWCGPCKAEIPHLKKLGKKFHGRNIVFVSLSVDENRSRWESMVKGGSLSGVQLHLGTESDFLTAYGVRGIPRFILLDPESKIIDPDMTRPSSPDTEKFLSGLEGL